MYLNSTAKVPALASFWWAPLRAKSSGMSFHPGLVFFLWYLNMIDRNPLVPNFPCYQAYTNLIKENGGQSW